MKKNLNRFALVSLTALSVLLSGCSDNEKNITQIKVNAVPTLEDRIASNLPKEREGLMQPYKPPVLTASDPDFNNVIAMQTENLKFQQSHPTNIVENRAISDKNTINDSQYQANLNKTMNINAVDTNSIINNTNEITNNQNNISAPPPGEVNPILDSNI